MSFNKIMLSVHPKSLPKVRRNCPKCNEKSFFINTGKFRVNANKNNIDVWLIYQCEECKATKNMTVYERVNPSDIDRDLYDKFLANDLQLAKEYAFDMSMYSRNKSEVVFDSVEYDIEEERIEDNNIEEGELLLEISCPYPVEGRLDKLLSERLDISRSKIKKMHKEGFIRIDDEKNSIKSKIKDGMKIHIYNVEEKIGIIRQKSA